MQTHCLPRWRGFNLLDFFTMRSAGDVPEDDLRWIRDWGFDFVRLPMCYTLWCENDDPARPTRETTLARIDRAVELCGRYGLHCCLNFHRAPGYSVNRERAEPYNLWKDAAACDAFCRHWALFARRYRGMPSSRLSFDLVNEPPMPQQGGAGMSRDDHARVVRAAVAAIRAVDPDRRVLLDGLAWGNLPCPELADLPAVGQSCRAYAPMGISHYRAAWAGEALMSAPLPVWPGAWNFGDPPWDRRRLEAHYAPWIALAAQGVGVHCGEGGAFMHTPHDVLLHWFRDVLEILTPHGIGYALWNFRGSFGILDSGRDDVTYEDWHGHRLDRAYLELLQAF